MATRSNIAIQTAEGIKAIYCHFDGYLEGVGRILQEYYNTYQRVNQLIELGNIRSIQEALSDIEPYEEPSTLFENEQEYIQVLKDWIEYAYLFKDGEWYVASYSDTEFSPIIAKIVLGD